MYICKLAFFHSRHFYFSLRGKYKCNYVHRHRWFHVWCLIGLFSRLCAQNRTVVLWHHVIISSQFNRLVIILCWSWQARSLTYVVIFYSVEEILILKVLRFLEININSVFSSLQSPGARWEERSRCLYRLAVQTAHVWDKRYGDCEWCKVRFPNIMQHYTNHKTLRITVMTPASVNIL